MTENEAIISLKDKIEELERITDNFLDVPRGELRKANKEIEMCNVCVSTLEEIQQYRAIGTVEEIKKVVQFLSLDNDNGIIEDLQLLNKYQFIGTVEECREAREKQKPKKPNLCMNEVSGMFVDYADGHGEYKTQMNNWWRCPCCNEVVGQRVIVHEHIHDQRKNRYCENCGQAIDWSE